MQGKRFMDRENELEQLDAFLGRNYPGPGQLIVVYGRRRVGKTTLLEYWGKRTGKSYVHWSVQKGPASLQRQRLYALLLNIKPSAAPTVDGWLELWEMVADLIKDSETIIVIDELPYAARSDPELLSSIQHAWDRFFQGSNITLVLAGSQVSMMEELRAAHSPLGGRVTGILNLEALPFSSYKDFFPDWPAEERINAYATVGGIPAYMEWLNPRHRLEANIRNLILSPGGMFREEPELLLIDEVRDPGAYLSVLYAIGLGFHTFQDIVRRSQVKATSLPETLATLRDLRLIERRLPATIPPGKRKTSKQARWHIKDSFLRFYFRFIAPYQDTAFNPQRILQAIQDGFDSFVGRTAFEELCRRWVMSEGIKGRLPFKPEICESHWRKGRPEVDVVAINWKSKDVLVGECKWSDMRISASVVQELLSVKIPEILRELPAEGAGWKAYPFLFVRRSVTEPAKEMLESHEGRIVDLEELDSTLP